MHAIPIIRGNAPDTCRSAMSSWSVFREKARRKYGLDMAVLDNAYHDECVDYFVMNSVWRELAHHQVIAEPIIVKGEGGMGYAPAALTVIYLVRSILTEI